LDGCLPGDTHEANAVGIAVRSDSRRESVPEGSDGGVRGESDGSPMQENALSEFSDRGCCALTAATAGMSQLSVDDGNEDAGGWREVPVAPAQPSAAAAAAAALSGQAPPLAPSSAVAASDGETLMLLDGDLKVFPHQVLGHGCGGTYCVAGSWEGMNVAVKCILRELADDAMGEKRMLRAVTHRNVLRFFTSASDASRVYLVLERCDCNLEQAVERGQAGVVWARGAPSAVEMQVARGMAEGIAELHRLGVVHRDLKPRNVLLAGVGAAAGELVAKISDLGLSKRLEDGHSSFATDRAGGTRGWQAPEQLQPPPGGVYRMKKRMDIFSLGCLLFYCWTGGGHPFPGQGLEQLNNMLHGRADLSALKHLPLHQALVGSMLAVDPAARPRMEAVLAHPVWWAPKERLQFLCRLSDFLAGPGRGGLRKGLHSTVGAYVLGGGGGWTGTLDGSVLDALQRPPHGTPCGDTVPHLLRAVRNTRHHAHQWPQEAQGALGGAGEAAVYGYFSGRLPRLFPAVWQWACGARACLAEPDLVEQLRNWADSG